MQQQGIQSLTQDAPNMELYAKMIEQANAAQAQQQAAQQAAAQAASLQQQAAWEASGQRLRDLMAGGSGVGTGGSRSLISPSGSGSGGTVAQSSTSGPVGGGLNLGPTGAGLLAAMGGPSTSTSAASAPATSISATTPSASVTPASGGRELNETEQNIRNLLGGMGLVTGDPTQAGAAFSVSDPTKSTEKRLLKTYEEYHRYLQSKGKANEAMSPTMFQTVYPNGYPVSD
jgi:hypothetical protein